MTEQNVTGPTLPVQRAFVVQFRTEAEVERGPFVGRVEHVVSGEAARFSSLDELLAFMARVLAETGREGGHQ
jgi:hypothetical protein